MNLQKSADNGTNGEADNPESTVNAHRTTTGVSFGNGGHQRKHGWYGNGYAQPLQGAQNKQVNKVIGKNENDGTETDDSQPQLDKDFALIELVAESAHQRLKNSGNEAKQRDERAYENGNGEIDIFFGQFGHVERNQNKEDAVAHGIGHTRNGQRQHAFVYAKSVKKFFFGRQYDTVLGDSKMRQR